MKSKRSSVEIAAEIAALEKERDEVWAEIQSLEESLKTKKARLVHLTGMGFGSSYDRGHIARLRRDLESAKLRESDELAMKVRAKTGWQSEFEREKVLRKVTKKQIFLASPGCSSTERYDHSGVGSYGTIHPDDLAEIMSKHGAANVTAGKVSESVS
jgi:hypothetical protein